MHPFCYVFQLWYILVFPLGNTNSVCRTHFYGYVSSRIYMFAARAEYIVWMVTDRFICEWRCKHRKARLSEINLSTGNPCRGALQRSSALRPCIHQFEDICMWNSRRPRLTWAVTLQMPLSEHRRLYKHMFRRYRDHMGVYVMAEMTLWMHMSRLTWPSGWGHRDIIDAAPWPY